ncbi:unnamed protein product [Peronospora destructor]|uniref:acid phosphatase n=1 Tax=Peronospora destructor TaxID=86335 RepID=A0AAV0VEN7_9STRA|nr:unnamed protein product [Peronospora destructor]
MVSVLFVCLGNICRSPAGEAVFKDIVAKKAGTNAALFLIDSCGTGGGNANWYSVGGWSYHEGDRPDSRMTKEVHKRGYSMTSRSRPLKQQDIDTFDYIICMDNNNKAAVLEAAESLGWCSNETRVPDPWYEGGFDHVLDLLEDACDGLYNHIVARKMA